MSKPHKVINGVIDGLLAAFAVFMAGLTAVPVWIIFLAWLSYYLFGKNVKSAFNTYILILLGISLAMVMVSINQLLMPLLGSSAIFIVVFLSIGSLTFVEGCKWFGNLGAYFLGLIIFFGAHKEVNLNTYFEVSIPLLTGFGIAWLSNTIRLKVQVLAKSASI